MSTSIRGVLFDVDDTLVDLRAAMASMFSELSAQWLRGHSAEARQRAAVAFAGDVHGRYERYLAGELGFGEQRAMRFVDALAEIGVAAPEPAVLEEWNSLYEAGISGRWAAFDDVGVSLDRLRAAGVRIAAVTNNVADYQRRKLSAAGLAERFSAVIGIEEAAAPKPAPEMFHAGARAVGLGPSDCAYVGDNPIADGEGARDAGMVSVLVDRGGGVEAPCGVTKVASCEAAVDFVLGRCSRVE